MHRRRLAGHVIVAALAGGLGGCDAPRAPDRYTVLSGSVLACDAETGEMTVELSRFSGRRFGEERLHCVVNKHSELYINDKLSALSGIQVGDTVELVGRRDPARGLESFVVSFAYFNHPEPPVAPPALLAEEPPRPESQPADSGPAERERD